MKNVKKVIVFVLLGTMCVSLLSFAQVKSHYSYSQKTKKMKAKKEQLLDSTVVRIGIIDLVIIDKNKDGKVYRDQMDWNVLSEQPGKCPLCKMTLQEVTIEAAKKNLKANGFKVNSN